MTKITNFVWNPVDDCVISELDGTGSVQAVYTNEPQQYGGVLSQRRGTTTSTLHADALGTTRVLTDSSGSVTDTYVYDAWGNPITSSGTTVNPFRWVGRYGYYQDASTGLVYVRARMYQPTIGRWLNRDPQGFEDGVNLLSYVHNRVVTLVDPSGKCCCCCVESVSKSAIEVKPLPGELFDRWQFHFQIDVNLKNVVSSSATREGHCTIEWFECSPFNANLGQKAGKWSRFTPETAASQTNWDEPVYDCPVDYRRYFKDAPSIKDSLLDGTAINFAVKVKSSGDSCPCSIVQIEKYFNLVVQLVERFPNGNKPPKFDPDPPILRSGLDPRIIGCDHGALSSQFGNSTM